MGTFARNGLIKVAKCNQKCNESRSEDINKMQTEFSRMHGRFPRLLGEGWELTFNHYIFNI